MTIEEVVNEKWSPLQRFRKFKRKVATPFNLAILSESLYVGYKGFKGFQKGNILPYIDIYNHPFKITLDKEFSNEFRHIIDGLEHATKITEVIDRSLLEVLVGGLCISADAIILASVGILGYAVGSTIKNNTPTYEPYLEDTSKTFRKRKEREQSSMYDKMKTGYLLFLAGLQLSRKNYSSAKATVNKACDTDKQSLYARCARLDVYTENPSDSDIFQVAKDVADNWALKVRGGISDKYSFRRSDFVKALSKAEYKKNNLNAALYAHILRKHESFFNYWDALIRPTDLEKVRQEMRFLDTTIPEVRPEVCEDLTGGYKSMISRYYFCARLAENHGQQNIGERFHAFERRDKAYEYLYGAVRRMADSDCGELVRIGQTKHRVGRLTQSFGAKDIVFKEGTIEDLVAEKEMTLKIKELIKDYPEYDVPQPICIFETVFQKKKQGVYVMEQVSGKTLFERIGEGDVDIKTYLGNIVEYVAILHQNTEIQSYARIDINLAIRDKLNTDHIKLKEEFRDMIVTNYLPIIDSFKDSHWGYFCDGHPENWVVTDTKKIIKIDNAESKLAPVEFDLANLLNYGSYLKESEKNELLEKYYNLTKKAGDSEDNNLLLRYFNATIHRCICLYSAWSSEDRPEMWNKRISLVDTALKSIDSIKHNYPIYYSKYTNSSGGLMYESLVLTLQELRICYVEQ